MATSNWQHSLGHRKSKDIPDKTCTFASLTMLKPLIVWITKNVENSSWDVSTRPLYLPLEKPECRSRSNQNGHGTIDWVKIGRGVHQGWILSPCLFNWYVEYIIQNTKLDKTQPGIKISGRNINNLRYADDTTVVAESKEELKSLLMKVKRRVKKLV